MKYQPIKPNAQEAKAKDVKLPLTMDPKNKDIGSKTKITAQRVRLHSTDKANKTYGFKAFLGKEAVEEVEPPKGPEFSYFKTLMEEEDNSLLTQNQVAQLKKLIRQGVTKPEGEKCQWKDTAQLVNQAYKVAQITIPRLHSKGWHQYTNVLIPYAVKLLVARYGLTGPNATWRTTSPVISENVSNYSVKSKFIAEQVVAVDDSIALDIVTDIIEQSVEDCCIVVSESDDGFIHLKVYSSNVLVDKVTISRDLERLDEMAGLVISTEPKISIF